MKKLCRVCGEEKDADSFPLAGKIKGKVYRRRKCQTCFQKVKSGRRRRIKQWFDEFKKTLKCQECNDSRHYVLDFHHRDPKEKEKALGEIMQRGWSKKRIMKEVDKCDVYCANCHRELHYKDNSQ